MALKSNELRIGNFISHETWGDHVVMEVKEISQYRAYLEVDTGYLAYFNLNEANGIKLNDEWLVKLGFELQGLSKFWKDFIISQQYVHQLQNLYFAVTGTELVLSGSEKF